MKKTLFMITTAVLLATLTTTSFALPVAWHDITNPTEAQTLCANPSYLTFATDDPSIPNNDGTITGSNKYNIAFTSTARAIEPLSTNPTTGAINGVQFNKNLGSYGHIADDEITCYYVYTDFLNITDPLKLSGKI